MELLPGRNCWWCCCGNEHHCHEGDLRTSFAGEASEKIEERDWKRQPEVQTWPRHFDEGSLSDLYNPAGEDVVQKSDCVLAKFVYRYRLFLPLHVSFPLERRRSEYLRAASLFTTFTLVFEQNYGFTTATSGLAYLGVGVGSITGQVTYTYFANRLVSRHLEKGDFKPEHRLPLMFPGAVAMPIGLCKYSTPQSRL